MEQIVRTMSDAELNILRNICDSEGTQLLIIFALSVKSPKLARSLLAGKWGKLFVY